MLNKIKDIGLTYLKGGNGALAIDNADVDFTKAVEGSVKAIPVLDVWVETEDGNRLHKMSLREVHAALTNAQYPPLSGIDAIPSTREEDDAKGAEATKAFIKRQIVALKIMATSGSLYADYSMQTGLTKDNQEGSFAKVKAVFAIDADTVASITKANCTLNA